MAPITRSIIFSEPASTFFNVFDFIPSDLIPGIVAGTSTTDVSVYLNAAHAAAGVGGEVYYPKGTYRCENVQYLSKQFIHGAGKNTVLKQLDNSSNSVLVMDHWFSNNTTSQEGPIIENMSFASGSGSLGGYGLVVYGFNDRFSRIAMNGFGFLLTSSTANGTPNTQGQTQNHNFSNLDIRNAPLGGINSPVKVTDTMVTFSLFFNCGTAQTIGVLDVFCFAGWHIISNKMYTSPGMLIHGFSTFQNLIIANNNLDWDCTAPATAGTYNYAISLKENASGGLVISDNILRLDAADATRSYKFTFVDDSSGAPINHVGNRYFAQSPLGSTTDMFAFSVSDSAQAGASIGNDYDNFTVAQQGNGETILGYTAPKVFASAGFMQNATDRYLSAAERLGSPNPGRTRSFLYDDMLASIGSTRLATADMFYVLAAANETIALQNIAAPGIHTLTKVGTPVFVVDRGYTGDGVSAYLSTGIAGFQLTNFVLGSGTVLVWTGDNQATTNSAAFGEDASVGSTRNYINPRTAGGLLATKSQQATGNNTTATADSVGGFGWARTSVNNYKQMVDGASIATITETATALGTSIMCLLRDAATFSNRNVLGLWVGSGLADADVAAIDAAMKTYLAAVGAPT